MSLVRAYYYDDGSMMLIQGNSQIALSYRQLISLLAGHGKPEGDDHGDILVTVGATDKMQDGTRGIRVEGIP